MVKRKHENTSNDFVHSRVNQKVDGMGYIEFEMFNPLSNMHEINEIKDC